MNRRAQLAAVFADTQEFIASTPQLKEAARQSAERSVHIDADEWPSVEQRRLPGTIRVSSHRSLEAARSIANEQPGLTIAVHNFASPTTPGGGVRKGSPAQEESLCRCSTLYEALDQKRMWDAYYGPNRAARSVLATDACIWTPDVVVCKSDVSLPQRLAPQDWLTVNVITCAAPNLHARVPSEGELSDRVLRHVSLSALYALHVRRARHLLAVAASHGVEALVVGAFGCGAFQNDPYIVSSAWHEALGEWRHHFGLIEFAVFHMPYETENYRAFQLEFAGA